MGNFFKKPKNTKNKKEKKIWNLKIYLTDLL